MEGFLNLNKAAGMTSHDCVAGVRRLLRLKRVGHGGTLDPAATGVLPIALGKATRLLQFMAPGKAYRATVRFGLTTTTDDLEGEVIDSKLSPDLTLAEVERALPNFVGTIEQMPPIYSAIKVKGKKLYDLARQGENVDVPSRTVEVYGVEVLEWREGDFPEVELAIACGGGTYIRAIARDLGNILNRGATLAALSRTESCGFCLRDSLTLQELETHLQEGNFHPVAADKPLGHLPAIALSARDSLAWCQGQRILYDENLTEEDAVRVYGPDEEFLGIGQCKRSTTNLVLAPRVVVKNP